MKIFRVHCWLDVRADDEELAVMTATVQLSVMVGEGKHNTIRAGIPGKPKQIIIEGKKSGS